MGCLMDGFATVWRDTGSGFERETIWPARVERRDSVSFGAVQPLGSGTVKAFTISGARVEVGDYVADGDVRTDVPCDGCSRVVVVEEMTLFGRIHHTEVTAR